MSNWPKLLWAELTLVLTVVLGTVSAASCGCGFEPLRAVGVWFMGSLTIDAVALALWRGVLPPEQARGWQRTAAFAVLAVGLWVAVVSQSAAVLLMALGMATVAWWVRSPATEAPAQSLANTMGWVAGALAFAAMMAADMAQRQQWFVIPLVTAGGWALVVGAAARLYAMPSAHTPQQRWPAVMLFLATAGAGHAVLAISVAALIAPSTAIWGLVSAPLLVLAALVGRATSHQSERWQRALLLGTVWLHGAGLVWGFAQVG
jgi:1,4-dihydroxy-2-naphthoate octaprenyltransferase